ncbi:MAG: AhpA/YtjB family protein, partial [Haemophilus parainfluenzae]|nr:AhpA/YtjB family protein [Haemophilus parainfluenzae]
MQLIKEKLQKSLMFGLIVLLCIGSMAVILFGVEQFKLGSQLSSVNQVASLSHTLVRQQAN